MFKQLLLIFFILSSIHCHSQNIEYEFYYENDSCDIGPGNFIRGHNGNVVGIVSKAPIYDSIRLYKPILFTIDSKGDTSSIFLGKQDTALVYSEITLIEGNQPGYYLAGMGYSTITKDQPNWFTIFSRIDTSYNILWERIFIFDFTYHACSFRAFTMQDGSLLFCCNPGVITDFFIFHLSSTGDSLKFEHFNGDESGRIWDISNGSLPHQYWLFSEGSFDPSGAVSCTRLIIDSAFTILGYSNLPEWFRPPFNAKKYVENDALLCGTTEISHPINDTKFYISGYRIDTSSAIRNQVLMTNPDTISRAAEYKSIDYYFPSNIYLGGSHNFQGFWGQNPSWILVSKLDDTLGTVYEKYFGGDKVYTLNSIVATNDGGVLLVGTQREFGTEPYYRDGFFIKLDSTSNPVAIHEGSKIQLKEVLIYPNPGNNSLSIRTALKGSTFTLFDMRGIPVIEGRLNNLVTTISVEHLEEGTYYYVVKTQNNFFESGKWIKSK